MPDQPDDPLHYETKIPPEPKDATLHKDEEQSDSDKVSNESGSLENSARNDRDANPPRSSRR